MVYSAQLDSYENCNEVLKKYTGIEVSPTQVWRVANTYGNEAGHGLNDSAILTPCKKDEVVYAMADGSMIFTREDGWEEVKVGRIFKSSDCIHAAGKPGWISNSQYVARLDTSKKFTSEMEKLLDYYADRKQPVVFISDGAAWIRNWIEDAYPNAVSVLDFYHAAEYLHTFCKAAFKDEAQRKDHAEKYTELLLLGEVGRVIQEVSRLGTTCKEAGRLIDYYEANQSRMNYPEYKKMGVGIIGSGAIESAHRTVVQKRMKQSGQRWGKQGAQNMLNLRVVSKNNQWHKIVELTKINFATKAA